MNKVVFLDRDGTINYDYGYVYQKDKLKILPGVIEGLKKLQDNDYKLIIVTNQSGIGRDYFTINQYNEFNEYMIKKLKEKGVTITAVYFCPHVEEDNCNCRKPKTGMIDKACIDFDIDLSKSYYIGDKDSDIQLAQNTNIIGKRVINNNFLSICNQIIKEN